MSTIPQFLSSIGVIPTKQDIDKKNGLPRFWACCPLHEEKTPSFIYTDLHWYCFARCQGPDRCFGGLAELYSIYHSIPLSTSRSRLGIKPLLKKPQRIRRKQNLEGLLKTYDYATHILSTMSVDPIVVKMYGIRFANYLRFYSHLTGMEYTVRDKIIFPIYSHDCLSSIIARKLFTDTTDECKYKFLPFAQQKASCLFGTNQIIPNEVLYAVEGPMDVLALRMQNKSSVALLGCSLTMQQHKLLLGLSTMFNIPKIVFLFDGDAAGRLGGEKANAFLKEERYTFDFEIDFCKENHDPFSMYTKNLS